jgi:hypothetical protein
MLSATLGQPPRFSRWLIQGKRSADWKPIGVLLMCSICYAFPVYSLYMQPQGESSAAKDYKTFRFVENFFDLVTKIS